METNNTTLKNAWVKAMCDILYSEESIHTENYTELIDYHTKFGFADIDELKEDKRINSDFIEMEKVFFTNMKNSFGHSYRDATLTPLLSETDPINALSILLGKNATTRKAVLTFAPYGEEKIPCINTIQLLVRNNRLDIIYNARGQDVFRKFPCDAMCIAEYGLRVAIMNNYELGTIYAHIASAHIYDENVDDAQKCISKYQHNNIIFTGNIHKYDKYSELLRKNGLHILHSKIELPEIQSTDTEKVSCAKAKYAYEKLGVPVWVDDVTLSLEAYPSFPGPYTKSVFKQIGIQGLAALLHGKSHNATLKCTLCKYDGKEYDTITGVQSGIIDCSKEIADSKMPLNSIFIGEGTMQHREKALNDLIQKYLSFAE